MTCGGGGLREGGARGEAESNVKFHPQDKKSVKSIFDSTETTISGTEHTTYCTKCGGLMYIYEKLGNKVPLISHHRTFGSAPGLSDHICMRALSSKVRMSTCQPACNTLDLYLARAPLTISGNAFHSNRDKITNIKFCNINWLHNVTYKLVP